MNDLKSVDIDRLKDGLRKIHDNLKSIAEFDADENAKFQRIYAQIEQRTLINNKRVKDYLNTYEKKPSSIAGLQEALEIQNQNSMIHGLKIELNKKFIEDIYDRIDRLGRGVRHLCVGMSSIINQLPGEVTDHG